MIFPDALRDLLNGSKIKQAGWEGTWLEQRSTANGPNIFLYMDGGKRVVSWTPTQRDLFDTTWEITTEKPDIQVISVPPNDFFKPMGSK